MRPLPARLPVPAARVRLDAGLVVPAGLPVPAARVLAVPVVPAARVLAVPGRAR